MTGWRHHRGVAGYVLVMVFVLVAMQLYVRSVNHDLRRVDRRTCRHLLILASNQADVIRLLMTLPVTRETYGLLSDDLGQLNRSLARGC